MKIRFAICALFFCIAGTLFAEEKIRVVTTFSVPADWVRQIAGTRAEVISLVPENADNHAFQPSPGDIKKLQNADFVFAISPQFETWFDAISKNLRKSNPKKFIFLAEKFFPKGEKISCCHAHDSGTSHACESFDPHLWTDPEIVAKEFVPAIAKTLQISGENYAVEILKFQAEAEKQLAAFPPARRKIVTYHRNMTHFAKRFSIEVAGTILAASSTEATDPSAKTLFQLSKKIRENRIPIFVDNTVSSRVPAMLAREAGVPAPKILRVDALDFAGTPAGTYLGMMRANTKALCEAFLEHGEK